MEKVRPRCGQPSDQGRLKNRTEQNNTGVQRSAAHLAATGTRIPYATTQCYLPPGRRDIPATCLYRSEAGTRISEPGVMQG